MPSGFFTTAQPSFSLCFMRNAYMALMLGLLASNMISAGYMVLKLFRTLPFWSQI